MAEQSGEKGVILRVLAVGADFLADLALDARIARKRAVCEVKGHVPVPMGKNDVETCQRCLQTLIPPASPSTPVVADTPPDQQHEGEVTGQ